MAYNSDKASEETKASEIRKFDGSNNNKENPEWGQADKPLLRTTKAAYTDGSGIPRSDARLNPRKISNIVCASQGHSPHSELSSYMWAWGQYVDHEITLSLESEEETLNFKAPKDDPDIPEALIHFHRSLFAKGTGTSKSNPRQQINVLPAYIDAANVYGAHCSRAVLLRRLDGTGKLKSTVSRRGSLLPYNTMGLANAQGPLSGKVAANKFFVAGDFRVNEHNVLTCMHTLFMREHNRLCDEMKASPTPALKREIKAIGEDEAIFQRARRIVGALEQVITYEEFLPALLGSEAIPSYKNKKGKGYDENINADIANVFSAAAYRLGHDMLTDEIMLIKPDGKKLPTLTLHDAFFKPELIAKNGIEPYLNGLAHQNMEQIDGQMTDSIRTHLFNVDKQSASSGMPKMLLDLAAINIQRGRDHGLPDYNSCRKDIGLKKKRTFEEITTNPETLSRLKQAYQNVDEIDPWIGGLAEDKYKDAVVGEFFYTVIRDQFLRLRDGDRFWYENDSAFTNAEKSKLKRTTLSTIISRNTDLKALQHNVFFTEVIWCRVNSKVTARALSLLEKPDIASSSMTNGQINGYYVQCVVADPNDPSKVYGGTDGQGVFKLTNSVWIAINSGLELGDYGTLFVFALFVDSEDSSVLYAGTDGGGIWKSTNAGQSWDLSLRHETDGRGGGGLKVYGFNADKSNSSLIYAYSNYGVLKTSNGGDTWTPFNKAGPVGLDVYSLAVHPKNKNVIFAGTGKNGVYKSENGGKSWVAFSAGLSNSSIRWDVLVCDPKPPYTLYLSTETGVLMADSDFSPR